MAEPIRLISADCAPSPSLDVEILWQGDFGSSVAQWLHLLGAGGKARELAEHLPLTLNFSWPAGTPLIFVASRPHASACQLLTRYVAEHEARCLPIILGGRRITVGPLLHRNSACCWSCAERRALQHSPWPQEESRLAGRYASFAAAGPGGFLEPFALWAASHALKVMEQCLTGNLAARVWFLNLFTRQTLSATYFGIHGCSQCGLHRNESTRSTDLLADAVSYLWDASPA